MATHRRREKVAQLHLHDTSLPRQAATITTSHPALTARQLNKRSSHGEKKAERHRHTSRSSNVPSPTPLPWYSHSSSSPRRNFGFRRFSTLLIFTTERPSSVHPLRLGVAPPDAPLAPASLLEEGAPNFARADPVRFSNFQQASATPPGLVSSS